MNEQLQGALGGRLNAGKRNLPLLALHSPGAGIAGRGGPSTLERERVTLEGLCDRSGRRASLLAPVP